MSESTARMQGQQQVAGMTMRSLYSLFVFLVGSYSAQAQPPTFDTQVSLFREARGEKQELLFGINAREERVQMNTNAFGAEDVHRVGTFQRSPSGFAKWLSENKARLAANQKAPDGIVMSPHRFRIQLDGKPIPYGSKEHFELLDRTIGAAAERNWRPLNAKVFSFAKLPGDVEVETFTEGKKAKRAEYPFLLVCNAKSEEAASCRSELGTLTVSFDSLKIKGRSPATAR